MLTVGMYVAERYEIVSKVGAGGMSDVYKAKDHVLSRFVAIKVLKQEFSEDRNFVTKFRTEAQSAAGLEHPNIVNIYDVGSENGLHYIVMEYVEGITLKTYIEKKGQLTFKESVSIAIQVARGIEAAHTKHLIHRDIKPQNIIISTEGKVKVTDFGIARAASSNTISADVMGSVHYASPEQARNGFVDGRSDIYSLGIVMYEMVTGRVPFDGDTTVAVALQHLQEEMTPASTYAENLPVSMERIIQKCTQKNPDRRYQRIEELLNDLRMSLVKPDDDFVVIAPLVDNGKTKVISEAEIEEIKDRRGITQDPVEEEHVSPVQHTQTPVQHTQTPVQHTQTPVQHTQTPVQETTATVSTSYSTSYEEEKEEDDEDSSGLHPKLDRAMNVMFIVVAILIVGAIIYLIASITGVFRADQNLSHNSQNLIQTESQTQQTEQKQDEFDKPEKVEMISIVGYSEEEARDMLAKIGLTLTVSEYKSSDQVDGTVLSQLVDAGIEVAVGSKISVVVAGNEGGDEILQITDVTGRTESEATTMLFADGFEVGEKTYEYDEEVTAGTVISQDPKAGTTAVKGTVVNLVVSKGLKSVEVPYVIGYAKEQAEQLLVEAGLQVLVEEEFNASIPEGNVITQSISSGKLAQEGSIVTITVSKGAEQIYYSCDINVPIREGATAVKFALKDSNSNVLWSEEKYTFKDNSKTFNVKKTGIVGSSWGTLEVTWFGMEKVELPPKAPQEEPSEEQPDVGSGEEPWGEQPGEGTGTAQPETPQEPEYTMQEVQLGSESFTVSFEKMEE